MIEVKLDTVYDFEIFNNVVYFCGVKSNATGGYGVLGYFPLAGFPATTINYLNIPLFSRVKRIEVGTMAGQTHMVAIGDGIQGAAEIVDAIDMGGSWAMHFFDSSDKEIVFTDLAITDNYVVVTGYQQHNLFVPARVYYFDKPTSSGGTLSPLYIPWIEIYERSSHNIIIEACEGDAFVVALARGVNDMGSSSFILVAYDYQNHISTNIITEPYSPVQLKDIKYYSRYKISELLLYIDNEDVRYSVIYTLLPAMAIGNATAPGIRYDNRYINSIDKNSVLTDHFVASAINPAMSHIEHILYNFATVGSCLSYYENVVNKLDYKRDPKNLLFGHVDYLQNPVSDEASKKTVNVNNRCQSN